MVAISHPLDIASMAEPFFNTDFFRSLVTTFIGAMLAILAAFGIWWLSGRERRRAAYLRRTQLARALGESIDSILELTKEGIEMEDDYYFTVNIDLSLLEATRALKYEVIGDINLSRHIDKLNFHFSSLHKLIEVRFEKDYSGSTLSLSNIGRLRTELNSMIRRRGTLAIEYESDNEVVRHLKQLGEPTSQVWTKNFREWIKLRKPNRNQTST